MRVVCRIKFKYELHPVSHTLMIFIPIQPNYHILHVFQSHQIDAFTGILTKITPTLSSKKYPAEMCQFLRTSNPHVAGCQNGKNYIYCPRTEILSSKGSP